MSENKMVHIYMRTIKKHAEEIKQTKRLNDILNDHLVIQECEVLKVAGTASFRENRQMS